MKTLKLNDRMHCMTSEFLMFNIRHINNLPHNKPSPLIIYQFTQGINISTNIENVIYL